MYDKWSSGREMVHHDCQFEDRHITLCCSSTQSLLGDDKPAKSCRNSIPLLV